jgi:hypothetical protein
MSVLCRASSTSTGGTTRSRPSSRSAPPSSPTRRPSWPCCTPTPGGPWPSSGAGPCRRSTRRARRRRRRRTTCSGTAGPSRRVSPPSATRPPPSTPSYPTYTSPCRPVPALTPSARPPQRGTVRHPAVCARVRERDGLCASDGGRRHVDCAHGGESQDGTHEGESAGREDGLIPYHIRHCVTSSACRVPYHWKRRCIPYR